MQLCSDDELCSCNWMINCDDKLCSCIQMINCAVEFRRIIVQLYSDNELCSCSQMMNCDYELCSCDHTYGNAYLQDSFYTSSSSSDPYSCTDSPSRKTKNFFT